MVQEKVIQANAELPLVEEKEWRAGESGRLVAVKEGAKVELKEGALNTVVEYAMLF